MIRAVIRKFTSLLVANHRPKPATSYITAEETVRNATAENLSVCDYVEKIWDQQGQTDRIINHIASIIQLPKQSAVLEIGTGTGRYLEKTLEKIQPAFYESYEIAEDWNHYLRFKYKNVKVYQADGSSLAYTANDSIDLVTAHGVFVYLPFLASVAYFHEINRVLRADGYCIFDCFTEACFVDPYLNNWLQSKHQYPAILPAGLIKQLFSDFGFDFIEGFNNKYGQGITQYLVFQKTA
jgi:SAM-dependent methyltransferase